MRFSVSTSALSALLCVIPFAAPSLAAAPAPGIPASHSSLAKANPLHKAIAETGVLDTRIPGISLWHDYGAFGLYRLSDSALNALPTDVRRQIQLDAAMDAVLFDRHPINTLTGTLNLPPRLTSPPSSGPSLQLIQFVGPIKEEWLDAVRATGAKPIQYIANNAYMVWANTNAHGRLLDLAQDGNFVQYSDRYQPAFKLGRTVEHRIMGQGDPDELMSVDIQIYNHAGKSTSQKAIIALATDVRSDWSSVLEFENITLKVRVADLLSIAQLPDVVWIDEYFPPRLLDERQNQILAANFNTNKTGPDAPGYLAWLGNLGFSQNPNDYPVVSVVDDGVGNGTTTNGAGDTTLTVLGQGTSSRVAFSQNCTSDSLADGKAGHGHINASIVAGYNTQNSFPFTDPAGYLRGLGVNPFGLVGNTKFFNNAGSGQLCGNSYAAMIKSEQVNGALISSNSWGDSSRSYGPSAQAYDAGVRDANTGIAGNQEMIYIFAAGNDGPGSNTVGNPGNGKNMITVGASENWRPNDESGSWTDGCQVAPTGADNAMDVIGFSSRGPAVGGRVKPEVIAPGTHIQGTASTATGYDGSGVCDKYRPGSQTVFAASSGTSHSTPAVAGVASLYYRWLQTAHGVSAPSPALMKAYLIAHPTYLTGVSGGGNLPTNNQGYGMPDMAVAFDSTPRFVINQTHAFDNTGETWTWNGQAADSSKPVRIVMAYTDAPGSSGTSPQVNNLDLKAEVGGNTYLGNRFNGQWSTTGGSPDSANNYEAAFLPAGASGPLSITITAANIAGDGVPNHGDGTDQDFALVCYNCAQDPDFTLAATPSSQSVCAPDSATYLVNVDSIMGFVSPTTLTLSGNPAGTTANFSPTLVTPSGTSTLTIGNTGAASVGPGILTIGGTASGGTPKSIDVGFNLFSNAPPATGLTAPADAATGVSFTPTFTWGAAAQAASYTVQIATDAGFSNIFASQSGIVGTTWTSPALGVTTTYYWRVQAENTCGSGTWSNTFSFTTNTAPFPAPYCNVTFSNAVEPITRVTFAGIDNQSPAAVNGSPALEDFTAIVGNVTQGDTLPISVKGNTAGSFTTKIRVYFDWNQDGDFSDAGETTNLSDLINSTGTDSKVSTGNVTVPSGALTGQTRMRVLKKFSTAGDPCNTQGWGQAEDYTLNVTAPASNPVINVSPSSIAASQAGNTTTSHSLTIANSGGGTLNYNIQEAAARAEEANPLMTASRTNAPAGSLEQTTSPRANPQPMAVVIDEGFVNLEDLVTSGGWIRENLSNPLGVATWAQCGGTAIPPAFDGGSNDCALVNYCSVGNADCTSGNGTISNWLLTPEITFEPGSAGSFYTRTASGANYADRLEVRVCNSGDCSNFGSGAGDVGNFTTLLLTINPSQNAGADPTGINGYPDTWTQFNIPNLPSSGTGRIAFRYHVTSGGPGGSRSNIIGLDRVVVDNGTVAPPSACDTPANIQWLAVSPGSGSVSSGSSANETVTLDSTGMSSGTYDANLCVSSNDPTNPLIAVPVTMTVTSAVTHPITVNITPTAGGTASCTPNPVTHGGNSSCSATPATGYTFSGWSGDCTGASCDLTNVDSAKTVTATFTQNTYPITVNVTPTAGGTASCTPNPVAHGGNSSCSATPATGYTFAGWSGDCTGASCALASVDSAKTVTATFTQNTYPISVNVTPTAGGSASCTPNPVAHGGNSSCSATPATGYTFSGWSGDCTGANCALANVDSAKTVTATFTQNTYPISVNVTPTAGGTASCTPNPVAHGGNSSCSATPASGYTFAGWSGDCTGAICALANVDGARAVTATFEQTTYTVTPSVGSGSGTITPDTPQTINADDTISFDLTPAAGQVIHSVGGTCGGSLVGDVFSIDPITANCTVIVNFADVAIFKDGFED